MVFYEPKSPLLPAGFSKWAESAGLGGSAGAGMNVRIVLDQPAHVAYTNLDHISGHVVVRSAKSENVNSIVVKLEGESRTRLMSPAGPNGERPRPMVEYHKILYQVLTVFPGPHVVEGRTTAGGKAASGGYGLPAGEHVYPFSFKIPFNNTCTAHGQRQQQPMIVGMEIARPATRHVKKTLPPTLSGFPGEADIRYFVKCTVNRHGLLKENARTQAPFNFFPIENPRPPATGSECFARQKHYFDVFPAPTSPIGAPSAKHKMKSMLGMTESTPTSPPVPPARPPFVSIDARLPEPAILTCNQDIPLRLIFKKLSPIGDQVFMNSLQISLLGHTKIRAHDVYRTESNSWIICSTSNTNVLLGSPSDPVDAEHVLDDALWRGPAHALPNSVAPTFETCNIERTYQLDIRIGLSYGDRDLKVRIGQWRTLPQQVVLPLRLDCMVFSGIAPPAEVVARMEEEAAKAAAAARPGPLPPRHPSHSSHTSDHKLHTEGRMDSDFGSNQIPPTPIVGEGPVGSPWQSSPPGAGVGVGAGVGSGAGPQYDEAPPPSYADAIADRAPPVTAPRPTYAPPAQVEDSLLGGGGGEDEKKGWR